MNVRIPIRSIRGTLVAIVVGLALAACQGAGLLTPDRTPIDEFTAPPPWPAGDTNREIPAVAISAGNWDTCIVTADGALKCWGVDAMGQLGSGISKEGSGAAIDIPGLTSGFTMVSVGDSHVCALGMSGALKCWGSNQRGQLGDGKTAWESPPVDVLGVSSRTTAISVGGEHTCALTAAGGVECWGSNSWGQLGNGRSPSLADKTSEDRRTPIHVLGLASGVTAIAAGGGHTCAVTDRGGVKCWGNNAAGQLGNGTTVDSPTPVDVLGLVSGITAIAAGGSSACALTDRGGVKCWGSNPDGQLGIGTTVDSSTPVGIPGLASGVIAISIGTDHSCVLMRGGQIECWGANGFGQLGNGTEQDTTSPIEADLPNAVTSVSAGGSHTCALTRGGGVWCWGSNSEGQSGPGGRGGWSIPQRLPGFSVAISTAP